jgi:hypothetical protein
VIIAADRIEVRMSRAKIAMALEVRVQDAPDLDPVVLSLEAKLRRAGKGKASLLRTAPMRKSAKASSN